MASKKFILESVTDGSKVELPARLTVGRGADRSLSLTGGNLSRVHAELTLEDGVPWVRDEGSTNGTFVNGNRIKVRTALKSGDRIAFDVIEYVLHVESDEPPSDRTVIRVMPSVSAPPRPASPPPPPAPPPPLVRPAPEAGKGRLPPGWTEQSGPAGGGKTVFFTKEDIERMERERLKTGDPERALMDSVAVPTLLFSRSSDAASRFQLQVASGSKAEWAVGSDATREIRIDTSGVSGLHAKIINDGPRWKIVDQMSANGTTVNGKKVLAHFLKSGDTIAFGPVECEFLLPVQEAGRPVPAARPRVGKVLTIAAASFVVTIAVLLLLLWIRFR